MHFYWSPLHGMWFPILTFDGCRHGKGCFVFVDRFYKSYCTAGSICLCHFIKCIFGFDHTSRFWKCCWCIRRICCTSICCAALRRDHNTFDAAKPYHFPVSSKLFSDPVSGSADHWSSTSLCFYQNNILPDILWLTGSGKFHNNRFPVLWISWAAYPSFRQNHHTCHSSSPRKSILLLNCSIVRDRYSTEHLPTHFRWISEHHPLWKKNPLHLLQSLQLASALLFFGPGTVQGICKTGCPVISHNNGPTVNLFSI